MSASCAVCQNPADNLCSQCKTVAYCGRECQKNDWKSHKRVCKKIGKTEKDENERIPLHSPFPGVLQMPSVYIPKEDEGEESSSSPQQSTSDEVVPHDNEWPEIDIHFVPSYYAAVTKQHAERKGSSKEAHKTAVVLLKMFLMRRKVPMDAIGKAISIGRVNPNTCTREGRTLLHFAIVNGDTDAVQFLCENGAEVNAFSLHSPSPLHVAAILGKKAIVRYLLSHGADVNLCYTSFTNIDDRIGTSEERDEILCCSSKFTKSMQYPSHWYPIHWACIGGNQGVVETLIEAGARINQRGGRAACAWRPLHIAALWNHPGPVKALLQAGAHPELLDMNYNLTPLAAAFTFNFNQGIRGDRMLSIFSQATSMMNIGGGFEAYFEPGQGFRAGSDDDLAQILKALLQAGADPYKRYKHKAGGYSGDFNIVSLVSEGGGNCRTHMVEVYLGIIREVSGQPSSQP